MKAYSYIRWSSDPQTKGDSLKRQLERTRAVCRERGWELDESILPDMGVSAYTGKNIAKGSLAGFIHAVKAGRIRTPCVLCVEGLDRLTRLRVRDAKALFDQLLVLNVQICTAHNNKLYDESSLDNPIDLLFSIMELNAGHAYAAELGRKISAAWTRKKEAAANGDILTSRVPSWIILDKKRESFRIEKSRAKIVKRIFKDYLSGKGTRLIALALNNENIPSFGHGKGWSETTIKRYLTSRSVIGDLQPHKYTSRTKRVPQGAAIEGYYPAIIDKATFYQVQERMTERRTTKGARKHCFNLFSGLIECEKCGWTVVLKTGAVVKEGTKKPHIRLLCSKAWRGQGCEYKTIRYEPFERGIITGLFILLLAQSSKQQSGVTKVDTILGELKDTQTKIARLQKIMTDEDNLPKTLVKTLADLEALEMKQRGQLAMQPKIESDSLSFKGWKQMEKNLEGRILVQGLLSGMVKRIFLDCTQMKAKVTLLSSFSFSISWDENFEFGCFLGDKWQPYLDDILFWKGPRNIDISRMNFVASDEDDSPIFSLLGDNFGQPKGGRVALV